MPPEDHEDVPTRKLKPTNKLKDFLFDEEKFISEMENFHSKRRDELLNSIKVPRLTINLVDVTTTKSPIYYVTTQTPHSYSYAYENSDTGEHFYLVLV